MNSHEVFIHIHQGCFAGTGAIVRWPQCRWSKPDGYGKISQCITTTKHSKAKTVCIFLGIYCTDMVLEARVVSYNGNCRLTVPFGEGRCVRDALAHTFDIGVFKTVKENSTTIKIFTINLQTSLKVVMLLLTPMIATISYERCRWLVRRVWWHALAFFTQEITRYWAYVA